MYIFFLRGKPRHWGYFLPASRDGNVQILLYIFFLKQNSAVVVNYILCCIYVNIAKEGQSPYFRKTSRLVKYYEPFGQMSVIISQPPNQNLCDLALQKIGCPRS